MGYRAQSPIWLLFLTALLFVATAEKAHAYIDPGTGSYVLQVAVGAILAAGFAVKMFWSRAKARVVRSLRRRRERGA
jgi:uncharacterized membrane protein YbhN (UPF0104 family)